MLVYGMGGLLYSLLGLLYWLPATARKARSRRFMNLAEYASYDALGLAELVARKEVRPKELALTAAAAREKIDGT